MNHQKESEKKQFIKESARRLFNHYGFHKTSLDDIARQCGLAVTTIYYYYPNKEAIFDEIVFEYAQELLQKVDAALDDALPADEKFRQFSFLVYKNLKSHAEQIGQVPNGFIESSPHGRPIIEKIRQLFRNRLAEILQEGIRQGIFDIENVELTLSTMMVMGEFISVRWLITHPETVCDKIIDEMNRIVLYGLLKH